MAGKKHPVVGVLALQGDFAEHIQIMRSMKIDAKEVRTRDDLRSISHLILPGGESTVIGMLLKEERLDKEILKRARNRSLALYGTCAGIILLAKTIVDNQKVLSLRLLDITVERNAYGTQMDSFAAAIRIRNVKKPIETSFIRAPKIISVGSSVEVIATHEKNPVVVRSGRILGSTFHTEVYDQAELHRMFLKI